jgi:uncharacterized LabA/DUF88 family protein
MAIVKIKGHEFNALVIRDSANRRAQQFKNNIISNLRVFGLTEDDIEIELERVAIKRVPAKVEWYQEGQNLHYTYKAGAKYVDNLYVVSKVLELEIKAVINGEKTIEEFVREFSEDEDVEEQRLKARELIGVEPDCLDLVEINKKYKKLAKEAHPDMPNGSTERFKELNNAHKILKRELS